MASTFKLFAGFLSCACAAQAGVSFPASSLSGNAGQAERSAYYDSHSIQSVEGSQVKINGTLYSERDASNFLTYLDSRGRKHRFHSLSALRATRPWFIPAGLVIGTAVGVVLGEFVYDLNYLSDNSSAYGADSPEREKTNLEVGAAAGLIVGAALGITASLLTRGTLETAPQKNADRYNRQLSKDLHLSLLPGPKAEMGVLSYQF